MRLSEDSHEFREDPEQERLEKVEEEVLDTLAYYRYVPKCCGQLALIQRGRAIMALFSLSAASNHLATVRIGGARRDLQRVRPCSEAKHRRLGPTRRPPDHGSRSLSPHQAIRSPRSVQMPRPDPQSIARVLLLPTKRFVTLGRAAAAAAAAAVDQIGPSYNMPCYESSVRPR